MIRRLLVIAFLAWNILALPSLCSAGMLEHACACGVSDNCGHESSCASDPCSFAKPSSDNSAAQALSHGPVILVVLPGDAYASRTDRAWIAPDLNPLPLPPALAPGARPLLA